MVHNLSYVEAGNIYILSVQNIYLYAGYSLSCMQIIHIDVIQQNADFYQHA